MSGEDFYAVLEVLNTATQEEIKLAYRKAVVKYHPDLHKNNADATKQMAAINEAYEILGDPIKRNNYNEGMTPLYSSSRSTEKQGTSVKNEYFYGFTIEDLFQIFFGKEQMNRKRQTQKKESYSAYSSDIFEDFFNKTETDYTAEEEREEAREEQVRDAEELEPQEEKNIYVKVILTEEEARKGIKKNINVEYSEPCPYCGGTGTISQGNLTHFCYFCEGTGQHKKKKTIKVAIPSGVKTGTKIYVPEMGNSGKDQKTGSALYLEIIVKS